MGLDDVHVWTLTLDWVVIQTKNMYVLTGTHQQVDQHPFVACVLLVPPSRLGICGI